MAAGRAGLHLFMLPQIARAVRQAGREVENWKPRPRVARFNSQGTRATIAKVITGLPRLRRMTLDQSLFLWNTMFNFICMTSLLGKLLYPILTSNHAHVNTIQ